MDIYQQRKDSIRESMAKIQEAINRQRELINLLELSLSGIDRVGGKSTGKEDK